MRSLHFLAHIQAQPMWANLAQAWIGQTFFVNPKLLVSKKSIGNRTNDYEGNVGLKTTFHNPILMVAFTSILISGCF